ncbi:MAG: hypothetical protein E7366_02600 [Clostridiales bacterium]|nr:hypothetical protein [Clostridiales bacterium]
MLGYYGTLICLIVCYGIGIKLIPKIKQTKLVTILFPCVVFVGYISCVISMGIKAGVKDWNFTNTLPTANVSPFMYCLTPLMCLFPKKARRYLYALVALLSLAMLFAGLMNCVFNIYRHYKFHWEIALDAWTHVAVSWFGVYLLKTKQTVLDKKTALIGAAIVIGVAIIMLILNIFLHTSFFGLSLYGEHNIYNVVVCESGYLSAAIYFLGVSFVLFAGAIFQKILNPKTVKKQEK